MMIFPNEPQDRFIAALREEGFGCGLGAVINMRGVGKFSGHDPSNVYLDFNDAKVELIRLLEPGTFSSPLPEKIQLVDFELIYSFPRKMDLENIVIYIDYDAIYLRYIPAAGSRVIECQNQTKAVA